MFRQVGDRRNGAQKIAERNLDPVVLLDPLRELPDEEGIEAQLDKCRGDVGRPQCIARHLGESGQQFAFKRRGTIGGRGGVRWSDADSCRHLDRSRRFDHDLQLGARQRVRACIAARRWRRIDPVTLALERVDRQIKVCRCAVGQFRPFKDAASHPQSALGAGEDIGSFGRAIVFGQRLDHGIQIVPCNGLRSKYGERPPWTNLQEYGFPPVAKLCEASGEMNGVAAVPCPVIRRSALLRRLPVSVTQEI
ncbi:hypothetical protein AJ87_21745 [Rhizobium yanglingense]|nr:hypothetical protein AJ87_21745 [Rhizobium yanglingense]